MRLRQIAVIVLLTCNAGGTRAQTLHHGSGKQIPEAGRWHVQTTSGDQPAQVATGHPVSFDGFYVCASTACGGQPIYAHDSTICDSIDFENQSSGMVINGTTGAFQFGVSGGFGDSFIYTFVGSLSETHKVVNGVTSLATATITGSYGSTPGGCNNGLPQDQGTFVATWYPPMSGTLYGVVVPVDATIPPFGVQLALTQSASGALAGTATTGRLVRLRGEVLFEAIQSGCFSSTTLALTRQIGTTVTGASGNLFQAIAVDTIGNSLTLEGVAIETGSNQEYTVKSAILGGDCNGASPTSASFVLLTQFTGANRSAPLPPGLEPNPPRAPVEAPVRPSASASSDRQSERLQKSVD